MVFLGLLYQKRDELSLIEKSSLKTIQNQANAFEWNLIEGLIENDVGNLKIISALPVGTWPHYKDILIKDMKTDYKGRIYKQIGSVNLPFIKQWQRYKKCLQEIKIAKDKKIVIYSTYTPYLRAISKLDASYDITVIVTDLPEFYDLEKTNMIRRILRKINTKLTYQYLKRVNKFVLLTEQMKTPLNVGQRPYTVVEGIYAAHDVTFPSISKHYPPAILYTGSLNRQFGIINLVDCFMKINGEYELWICGGGECSKEISSKAVKDKRIKYFGFVERAKALELQRQATLLVNPRPNEGEYTKYSFPSKTMEYLASGTPVIMYKLPGIPDEYDQYLLYVNDIGVDGLKKKVEEVFHMPPKDLLEFGERAKQMIINDKNEVVQAAKVLRLIDGHPDFNSDHIF